MKFTTSELSLILGAIDTLECEIIEQQDQTDDKRHEKELKALSRICHKIATEIRRRKPEPEPKEGV